MTCITALFFPNQQFVPTHRRGNRRIPRDVWYHQNRDTLRLLNYNLSVSPAEIAFQQSYQRETNNRIETQIIHQIDTTTRAIDRHRRLYRNSFVFALNRLRRRRHTLRGNLLRFRNDR